MTHAPKASYRIFRFPLCIKKAKIKILTIKTLRDLLLVTRQVAWGPKRVLECFCVSKISTIHFRPFYILAIAF